MNERLYMALAMILSYAIFMLIFYVIAKYLSKAKWKYSKVIYVCFLVFSFIISAVMAFSVEYYSYTHAILKGYSFASVSSIRNISRIKAKE